MRLRSTAPPSLRVTVKPTRGGPSSPRSRICTTTLRAPVEAPRAAARKSRLRFRRSICARPRKSSSWLYADSPVTAPARRSTPRASPGRACGAGQSPGARPPWTCGHGIHGAAYERARLAEKSVSRGDLRLMNFAPQRLAPRSAGWLIGRRALQGRMALRFRPLGLYGHGQLKSTRPRGRPCLGFAPWAPHPD